MEFSRQDYWSGWPFPSPGDLPASGMEPVSPALADGFFTTEPPGTNTFFFKNSGEDDVQLIYKCTHRCLTEHLKQSVYTDPQNHV